MTRVKIEKLVFEGKGLGTLENGKKALVKKTLPGEEVEFQITKKRRDFIEGWPEKWITLSPDRISPKCKYFNVCGGCSFQNIEYEKQIQIKKEFLKESLERIGKFKKEELEKIEKKEVRSPSQYHYRNKTEFSFEKTENEIILGFYNPQKRFHILPIDSCLLQSPTSEKALTALQKITKNTTLDVFAPQTPGRKGNPNGFLVSVFLRTNYKDEILIVLQTKNESLPEKEKKLWIKTLQEYTGKSLVGFIQMQRDLSRSNSPAHFETLFGKKLMTDKVSDLSFEIGPKSFFQVNREMAEKMVEIIREEIKTSRTKSPKILDLFCGNGFLGMAVSKNVQSVIGIEIEPSAVEEGEKNLKLNNIENYTFYEGDAGKILKGILISEKSFDIAIVDPPRAGLGEKCSKTLIDAKAEKIIYISCNPTSLARDARYIADAGYEIKSLQMMDLFPQTYHLETICVFTKQKS